MQNPLQGMGANVYDVETNTYCGDKAGNYKNVH